MKGLVRKAMLLAVCGLLTAGAAMAHVPDPANSECPSSCIKVVGHDGTVGDPAGEYCVTIRDFNNVPIENSSVVIDFSNCDIQLCVDQKDPDVIVDCVSQTVRKLTDVNGVACFRVLGKRRPGLDCTPKPSPCTEVFADGVFICGLFSPSFDLINEFGAGISGNDLSEFLHLFLDCGVYLTVIDYNCNATLDGDDLSQFLAAFFNGGSALNCDPPKDPQVGPKCP
jgi:hypothetical protein